MCPARLPLAVAFAFLFLIAIASAETRLRLQTATFLGGPGADDVQGAAAERDGDLYIVGNTAETGQAFGKDVPTVTVGRAPADPRCGAGFVARLSPDAKSAERCLQFEKGVVTLTSVAVEQKGVYVSGYASAALEELLANTSGLVREYPLKEDVQLIEEGKMLAENGIFDKDADPIGGRPGLGRYGAPFVLLVDKDLTKILAGTYLEGWMQVWDKPRYMGKGRPRLQEFFWQPTAIAVLSAGDVVVCHDGGYLRRLTDEDRKLAEKHPNLLGSLPFYDTCDYVSRLSPELAERSWKQSVYTPHVDQKVAQRVKNGWPHGHYGNPRTHRLRTDEKDNIFLCGWSASATSNEPWWAPYIWQLDPNDGRLVKTAYEYDPMSGGGNRMGGMVADTAVISIRPDGAENLLASLKADGGNSPIGLSPKADHSQPAEKMKGFMPHIANVVHHWGVLSRFDPKTLARLAGAKMASNMDGSAGPAWVKDMAPLADGFVLAAGRYNFKLDHTPDAWTQHDTGTEPSGFLRVYRPNLELEFSTAVPGLVPFEVAPISDSKMLVVGRVHTGQTVVKDAMSPEFGGASDGYLMLVTWEDVPSAMWHYRVGFSKSKDNKGRVRTVGAHLWLPPNTQTLRGILLMGQVSIEGEFAVDPRIRAACADNGIGIVFFNPHLSGTFEYWKEGNQDGDLLLKSLEKLAKVSGHPEIDRVPWITAGHSTAGIFARNVAYWKPGRVAGVIHLKSGNFHQANILPPKGSLEGIPLVAINGQFETYGPEGGIREQYGRQTQWIFVRKDIEKFLEKSRQHLMSQVVHAGADHFHGAPELAEYAAKFIRATAAARLPRTLPPGNKPVEVLPIRAEDGWLSDPNIELHPREQAKAAPFDEYEGDKATAMWHYNSTMAAATAEMHEGLARHQCLSNPEMEWLDSGDGWTFRAKAQRLDAMPEKYGGAVGDMPVEQVGPDTFRLLKEVASVPIAAFHPGGHGFRSTIRWGSIDMPRLKGKDQTIDFTGIGDIAASSGPVELMAKALSGLPVFFRVDYGPVILKDGKLHVAVPSGAKLPAECSVTAHQIGKRTEPQVNTAPPVTRTFRVVPAK